jgi:hypothetical protein
MYIFNFAFVFIEFLCYDKEGSSLDQSSRNDAK